MKLHNRKYLKNIRKHLRNHSTSAEAELWKILKHRQVSGYKFRRQHSVGKFILDFYCPELQLAIELDGEPHAHFHAIARDTKRDAFLLSVGISVLHYENRWVFEYPDVILKDITEFEQKNQLKNR